MMPRWPSATCAGSSLDFPFLDFQLRLLSRGHETMTLSVAFIRRLPERVQREELVFASDSRLSGGQRLDHGTKIFELPRTDALLSFAGQIEYAYPFAHQLITAIRIYPRSADRRYPLGKARGHMLRVFEQMYRSIHGLPVGQLLPIEGDPPVQFLFGGYIWHTKRFGIWYVDLDRIARTFRFRRGGRFFFIGDKDAVVEARRRTQQLLRVRGRDSLTIDMEPFEVLRDIIREGRYAYVGGAPQVAKVYEHLNTQFFATVWSHNGKRIPHIFGRPVVGMETCSWPLFEPDALMFNVDHASLAPTLLATLLGLLISLQRP
jgi:hypothetical protein